VRPYTKRGQPAANVIYFRDVEDAVPYTNVGASGDWRVGRTQFAPTSDAHITTNAVQNLRTANGRPYSVRKK